MNRGTQNFNAYSGKQNYKLLGDSSDLPLYWQDSYPLHSFICSETNSLLVGAVSYLYFCVKYYEYVCIVIITIHHHL